MGALQSRMPNFQSDFSAYQTCIDSIKTEHPIQVRKKLIKNGNFTSKKQIEAVVIIIYEKAILNTDLSLKCAQLVKELESETFYENNEKILFHLIFNDCFMKLVHSIIEKYDDSKMNDYAVQRGKSIAFFIGNLFVAEFLFVANIIEIGQAAKKKETKNNKFFIETIWKTVAVDMQQRHGFNLEIFKAMISYSFNVKNGTSSNDPDFQGGMRFLDYLEKISDCNHYQFYEHFNDFSSMREDAMNIGVKTFLGDAIKKPDFINVYRDIALEIHYMRPAEIAKFIENFLVKNIERYKTIINLNRSPLIDDYSSLDNFAALIIELFNANLIDNGILEKFIAITKSSKDLILIFKYVFVQILPKYQGTNAHSYLNHCRKYSIVPRDGLVPTIEEYINHRGLQVGKKSARLTACQYYIADTPDFSEYSSVALTLREANDPKNAKRQLTFTCQNRSSCHFASLRGIEILKNHIGNKFFTPKTIEICTKLTKGSFRKFQFENKLGENLSREIRTYLPYIQGDCKPNRKFANFSTLLANFYNSNLIDNDQVVHWMANLTEGIDVENTKYSEQLKKILVDFFSKISAKLENDNFYSWKMYANMLECFDSDGYSFPDFVQFTHICTICLPELNAFNLTKLKKLTIPNDKKAMQLITKLLFCLYSNDELSGPALAHIFAMLPTFTKNEFDKNLLRTEVQDVLCITLGHACSKCKMFGDDGFIKADDVIKVIENLCKKTFITRLGLVNMLRVMADVMKSNIVDIPILMRKFTNHLSTFLVGTKSLPNKVESIVIYVIKKMRQLFSEKDVSYPVINEVISMLYSILDKSEMKRNEEGKSEKFSKNKKDQENLTKTEFNKSDKSNLKAVQNPDDEINVAANKEEDLDNKSRKSDIKAQFAEELKREEKLTSSSSNSAALTKPSNSKKSVEPSTSAVVAQKKSKDDNESVAQTDQNKENQASRKEPEIQPKMSPEDIKEYEDYCDYFNSIEHKTSNDDKIIFDPILISSIRLKNKEQVMDIAKKFIERILAAQSSIIFFIQNVQKIGNAIQNVFKIKNQKISFQKILIDEIFGQFKNQELLLEFMCELYNNSFVNKSSMIAFVDKFKSQSPENINLMHTFIRTCAIRLSSQGDKEQLIQIRTIARSVKNLPNYDEDLKFLAQDLANSTNSLIQLLENGQNKPQVMTESAEKLVDDFFKNVLKNPQIYVKSAYKLDGKMKELLIQKIEKIIKEVPKFEIQIDEFMNLMEFVAELYNLDVLKNEFLTWTIEILMQSSTNEICSQSIEILFTKCGQKMENVNKHKLDIYMKFFEACLAEDNNEVRSENFRKIQKLKNRKWKNLEIPKNFYEDFLMLFSMNDAKIDELVEILTCDEEEIEKFIQILWKIILKDPPHPSYAALCLEIGKSCENFEAKLTNFFTARCITFIGFNAEMFNENVKERLGKVMTFIAEIYDNNLIPDKVLEMFLDQKLTSKLPTEFVLRIFSILSKCQRLDESQNDELKNLVKNFDKMSNQGFEVQIESLIKSVESLQTCGKGSLQPNTLIL